mgnify:CR=1 FL=1
MTSFVVARASLLPKREGEGKRRTFSNTKTFKTKQMSFEGLYFLGNLEEWQGPLSLRRCEQGTKWAQIYNLQLLFVRKK